MSHARLRQQARLAGLRWTFNRLRLMTPAEILWRLRQAGKARLEQRGFGLASVVPAPQPWFGKPWVGRLPTGFDRTAYEAAAAQILAGRFDIFALRDVALGMPPRWNRDPKTGIDAPLTFGKRLDYRNPALVGDIKYLWEPNRHYELVTLAQAFFLGRDERHAAACRLLLDSWFAQCPYPHGQGWSSALENAIRLVNWAFAWHLLGGAQADLFQGDDGTRFQARWLDSIYRHCYFIDGHRSLHSSANNHLIGECMGLFIGAVTWPCWPASAAWRDTAQQSLEVEALKQNGADGVNREQAIWYQHEVADMMLACGLFGRANGRQFSNGYWQRLERMLEFIAALMDAGGNMPMIGDADDASFRLACPMGDDPYRSLLASGAMLFDRPDLQAKSGGYDDKSRWLLGDVPCASVGASTPAGAPRAFAEGGYYILGHHFDTAAEVRVVADAGPLGYLGIAAHGHADALALTLSVAGKPILIDPGTYAYHTQPRWRAYFRGTSAHNTVRVDGLDQSVQGGNFMWLQKAQAHCERWESTPAQDCFIGRHDGYGRLPDPVIHTRSIVFLKEENTLVVEDTLRCRGTHEIEWHWHFAEACLLELADGGAVACLDNIRLDILLPAAPAGLILASGRQTPPMGWVSPQFDEKRPSPSLVRTERIGGTVRRETRMRISIL